jgi:hypothetical protein
MKPLTEIKKELTEDSDVIRLARKLNYNPLIHHKRTDHIYSWVQDILDLYKKEQAQEFEKIIKKFDFRKYSLCLNPIQEGKNIRQLKQELLKEVQGNIK